MKSRIAVLVLAITSMSVLAVAADTAPQAPPSEAQKSFDAMKALAGTWEGPVSVSPPMPGMGDDNTPVHITLRVTSRGNALVHEMQAAGTPLDPAKYDHPVTMFYLEDGRLILTHYCDAGNRPRMTGKVSADGKKVEFEFIDISGSNQYGHMYHAVFTPIDADHHVEDWTFMMPGDKALHAHFDLKRVQ